jgi:hypothetical protein
VEDDRDLSKFKLYSLGTAVDNNDFGLWDIEVTPIEQLNQLDGVLVNQGVSIESSGTDSAGNAYADKAVTSTTIKATWMGLGESNRRTAPNVVSGEEILIYTYEQTGVYYWTCRHSNNNRRRLETVVMAWSGSSASGEKAMNDDDSYMLEVSTHKKRVLFTNSRANGELSKFNIASDPGVGKFTVADDHDNEVTMDSLENRVTLITGNDCEVTLKGTNLDITVPGNETHTIQGNLNITVNGNALVNVKGNATVTVAGSVDYTAASMAFKAANFTYTGIFEIQGTLNVTGATTLNGASSPLPITAPNI